MEPAALNPHEADGCPDSVLVKELEAVGTLMNEVAATNPGSVIMMAISIPSLAPRRLNLPPAVKSVARVLRLSHIDAHTSCAMISHDLYLILCPKLKPLRFQGSLPSPPCGGAVARV